MNFDEWWKKEYGWKRQNAFTGTHKANAREAFEAGLIAKTDGGAQVPCSGVLSLLLEQAQHLSKCHSESIEHDDISKEKRYYRRGHRDAYADMIEAIRKAMKG